MLPKTRQSLANFCTNRNQRQKNLVQSWWTLTWMRTFAICLLDLLTKKIRCLHTRKNFLSGSQYWNALQNSSQIIMIWTKNYKVEKFDDDLFCIYANDEKIPIKIMQNYCSANFANEQKQSHSKTTVFKREWWIKV